MGPILERVTVTTNFDKNRAIDRSNRHDEYMSGRGNGTGTGVGYGRGKGQGYVYNGKGIGDEKGMYVSKYHMIVPIEVILYDIHA